jgi:hypothetical protein
MENTPKPLRAILWLFPRVRYEHSTETRDLLNDFVHARDGRLRYPMARILTLARCARPKSGSRRPASPKVRWFCSITRHERFSLVAFGYAVLLALKRDAAAAGFDLSRYSGHSLRAGFETSAAIVGASECSIMNQTGRRSTTILRRHIRDGSLFCENAANMLGL